LSRFPDGRLNEAAGAADARACFESTFDER
jgi:hypothetical protein